MAEASTASTTRAPSKKKATKSEVWEHFGKAIDEKTGNVVSICNYCNEGLAYSVNNGNDELENPHETHLVEGDASYWTQPLRFLLRHSGKDSTITSTSRNFDELPYWEFRYIRDIIRSLDLVLEDFILGEAQSIMTLDLFDRLENRTLERIKM
ncbi:hypothetical protein RND71_017126 [Anisodus tanguticus]|uniref:BED-type domain-containing protein n=1 Tax=Anisodus tanguticus TaxID=243964 RepID=A0AAE1VIU2_9SOLA|nr:hypothetical protein RND71_017126 [Anisodus tanguticus]